MRKLWWFWLGIPLLLLAGGVAPAAGPAASRGSHAEPSAARPQAATEHWLRALRQTLEAGEYHVSWSAETGLPALPAAYQAPNRAQNVRSYFTPQGALLVSRSAAAPTWSVDLGLKAVGREGARVAAGPATIQSEANRVEYRRPGLREWYVNDPKGVQQGFVVDTAPAGGGDLVLGLDTGAALRQDTGGVLALDTQTGAPLLRYGDLQAYARDGRALSAALAAKDGALELRVVAQPADYPVTVKALATSASWTAEGDQAVAQFGVSVAAAGDVNGDGYADVAVGAAAYDGGLSDEGRVYVYLGSATGLSASAAWTAESNQASAGFGNAVAGAGDVNGDGYADLLVGASRYDNGSSNEGRAYLYLGSATGLSASAAWTAESNQANAEFGSAVAAAGDVNGDGYADVIVGAPLLDNGQADEGRAYVYLGSATGPAASAAWTLESDQAGAQFGWSVASAGDVNGDGFADVIVGAHNFTLGQLREGRATVYHGGSTGLATIAAWSVLGNQADAYFGYAVASAGDVNGDGYADVIVGAYRYDNGEVDEGRASVYHGSVSGLSVTAAWTAESNQASAVFGFAVASAGDVNGDGYSEVVVGAPSYDNGQSNEGRAFLYQGSAAGLATSADWTAESDQVNATLGYAVAGAGDVNGDGYAEVLVSARDYSNGQLQEGRAFLYQGNSSGLADAAGWTAVGAQASANFGIAVASAGDVNGDGYADVIVGASGYDNGQNDEGQAFLYHGSATGLPTTASWTAEGNQASALFAAAVASAGDVNGDGYADVIIGAYQYDNGESNEGRAFLYLGGAAGVATTPSWTGESNQADARYGWSVAAAGDVNGDNYGDVIVGAPRFNNGQQQEGRAWLYQGGPAGLAASAAWTTESNQTNARFGAAVAAAGDVNGDGYADVVVGAPGYPHPTTGDALGAALLYRGGATGLSTTAAWTLPGNGRNWEFGHAVASAGDVNGDGYADVIVGEPSADGLFQANPDRGTAYVFHGGAGGPSSSWTTRLIGYQNGEQFGYAVASAGDVDGDGYADVIIGAPYHDNGETDEGKVYVYHGSASGLLSLIGTQTLPNWTSEGNQAGASYGLSVAPAGDVNGDGYADVIIGAPLYDNGQTDEGRSSVVYGNAAGRTVGSQQRQGGAVAALVSAWGYAQSADSFRVSVNATSPSGRQRVKLRVEACPLGVRFGNNACTVTTQPTWTDVTASRAGVRLTHAVTGLSNLSVYRWRARVLYAPFRVTAGGINPPPNPAVSPWRTFNAQAGVADIRTGGPAEIAVTANGNNIAVGATFNMGTVGVNNTLTRTFTITNTGLRTLELGTVSVVDEGPSSLFSLSTPPAASVAPGGSTSFQVTYSPAGSGDLFANVSFANSDPNESPYSFRVQARAMLAEMRVSLVGLPASARVGVAYTGTVQCINDPNADEAYAATCTVSGLPAGLTLGACTPAAPVAVLPSGGTISCPVVGTPTTVGVATVSASTGASNERFTGNNSASLSLSVNAPQEIAVSGNGQAIANGDSTPSVADHTDFGAVAVTSGTIVRTYTVSNLGTATLTLGALTIGGPHAANFSLITPPATSVAVGSGTSFQISFDPSAVGLRSASVSLANDDTDENPYSFSIQGSGTNSAPSISDVTNQSILEDGNTGALALTVGDAETPAAALQLSATSSNTALLPGANIVFGGSGTSRTVTLTPAANASGSSTVTLRVSDGIDVSADTLVLTVTAVNDAPVLSLGTVPAHPVGTTGVQTQTGFASVDLGPPDEDASQAVADFLIDSVSDPSGILLANSLDIANNGTLTYSLTGVGGTATISTRVRDSGGTANGGVDTSAAVQFTISVSAASADLQIAITNNRSALLNGEQTLYAIVVANNGPNAVSAASLSNSLPATLVNAGWMCVQAESTATCPSPSAGTGGLSALVNLGVNQYLRFDLLAEVNGAAGAFVANTVSVSAPSGIVALNPADDSATDQDPILPDGLHADGFESTQLTLPQAQQALEKH